MLPKNLGRRCRRAGAFCVLLAAIALTACNGESPEEKARAFVAKAETAAEAGKFGEAVIQYKNAIQLQRENADLRLQLGRLYLRLGEGGAAAKEIGKAREFGARNTETRELLARAWLLANDPAQAVEVIGEPPASPKLQAIRGLARLQQNDLAAAERDLQQSLAAMANAEAHVGLARVAFQRRDPERAVKHADAALALEPENRTALLVKAEALRAAGKLAQALNALDSNEAGAASDPRLQALRVALLLQAKRTDAAADALADLSEAAPDAPVTRFLTAQMHLLRQEFADAKGIAEGLLAAQSDHLGGLLIAGTANLALGHHESARQQLNRVLALSPGHAAAGRLVAHLDALAARESSPGADRGLAVRPGAEREGGRMVASAETSEKIGDLMQSGETNEAGNELVERVNAALSALRTGRHDEALRIGAELAEDYPENAAGPNIRGLAHMGRQDMAAAEKAFREAVEREPANVSAVLNLAEAQRLQGDLAGAGETLDMAADDVAGHARVLMARARVEMAKGNLGSAEALLKQAVEAQSEGDDALVALGRLYLVRNQPGEALETVAAAGEDADDIRLREIEALARRQLGDHAAAAATFEDLADSTGNQRYRLDAASAHLAAGDRKAALQTLRTALESDPDQVEVRAMLIEQLLATGDLDTAEAEIDELALHQPDSAQTFLLHARHAVLRGNLDDAIAHYQEAMRRDPRSETAITMARAQRMAGRRAAAQDTLRAWLETHPEGDAARADLASLLIEDEAWAAAAEQYRALLARNDDNATYHNNLAYAELKRDRLPQAAEHAEKALALAPGTAAILDTLGEIQLRRGEPEAAVESFRAARSASPQTPAFGLNLARALMAAGEDAEAEAVLDEVLAAHENDPSVVQQARSLREEAIN